MSRPDLRSVVLPEFFEKLFEHLNANNQSENSVKQLGVLKCLASIYKYGKREDLLKYTLPTLKHMLNLDLLGKSNLSLIRKFHIKIVQRVGITFFKFKIAKWRYERGSRVLMEKINKKQSETVTSTKTDQDEELESDELIPNELEDIIEQLLTGDLILYSLQKIIFLCSKLFVY